MCVKSYNFTVYRLHKLQALQLMQLVNFIGIMTELRNVVA